MERLLAVEIVERACRCCFTPFDSSGCGETEVTRSLKDVFMDLINDELDDGTICNKCEDYLLMFYRFKKKILMDRHNYKSQMNHSQFELWDEKDETETLIEDHVDDEIYTETFESAYNNQDFFNHKEPGEFKDEKEDMKSSKLKKLLQKYDVKFLDNNDGKLSKSPKIICPICLKVLSMLSFPVHLKSHEGGRDYNFMCEICSKKCISNSELIVHRRRHTKEKPFQCDKCPKRFFNCKKNLIQHLRNIHLNQLKVKKTLEQCKICRKKFSQDYLTHIHMKTAHPNGTHDGIVVNIETGHFHCNACGGQYRTRRNFDNHVCITGANDGPTQNDCIICSLKCKSRFETYKHIQNVHATKLKDNKWKCLLCEAIVLDKIVLHVESVHTPKSSKCGFCGKELKNRRCLRNHIYVVHQNGSEVRKQQRKSKKLLTCTKVSSV